MKTFLKPLSKEEESACLEALRGSDGVKAREAKQVLIERNLRLVAHIAKKYQNVDEDMEDLISIGTIGLIKAVESFDSSKNSKLATYAARCIDNELLMMLRSKKKTSREVSLYDPIGTDREGNEISLLDIIESPPVDIVEQYATQQDIRHLVSSLKTALTPREYQVICLRYGLFGASEETQKTIARKLSISRSYVSRIEKNALKKLRCLFDEQPKNHC